MPGGNFTDILKIDSDGKIFPSGPLTVEQDEELIEVYFWVTQVNEDCTGGACTGENSFERAPIKGPVFDGTWTTNGKPEHTGQFRPGKAHGTALLIAKVINSEAKRVFW